MRGRDGAVYWLFARGLCMRGHSVKMMGGGVEPEGRECSLKHHPCQGEGLEAR